MSIKPAIPVRICLISCALIGALPHILKCVQKRTTSWWIDGEFPQQIYIPFWMSDMRVGWPRRACRRNGLTLHASPTIDHFFSSGTCLPQTFFGVEEACRNIKTSLPFVLDLLKRMIKKMLRVFSGLFFVHLLKTQFRKFENPDRYFCSKLSFWRKTQFQKSQNSDIQIFQNGRHPVYSL